jgi:hypothetical protein
VSSNHIHLLKENITAMDSAIQWLERSYQICNRIGIKPDYLAEEYDAFETLTSRYARAIDLMVRKVFRTIDVVEFEQPGTLIDTINRTERRGLIDSIQTLREMTDLRNEIAHDYIKAELVETFAHTLSYTPQIIAMSGRIKSYVAQYFE